MHLPKFLILANNCLIIRAKINKSRGDKKIVGDTVGKSLEIDRDGTLFKTSHFKTMFLY